MSNFGIDPAFIKDKVKDELEYRHAHGYVLRPYLDFSGDKESAFIDATKESKTTRGNKKKKKVQESADLLDPLASFKAKEEAEAKKLMLDEEDKKRELIINSNRLIANLPKCEVTETQIYYMSSDEIRNLAVCKVISIDRGNELEGGLFDKCMGSNQRGVLCVTCNRDDKGCGGHYGYIELPEPVINCSAEEETILVADCVCPWCGDTYIDEKFFYALKLDKVPKKKLLKAISEISQKWLWKLHDHRTADGKAVAKTTYDREMKGIKLCYTMEDDNGKIQKYIRSIPRLKKIFSAIPKDKLKLLGFTGKTHPANFIEDCIPVCPPSIRPPSVVNGKVVDHPLTERYSNILTSIIRLKRHNVAEVDRETELENMYAHIRSIAFGPEKQKGVNVPLKESGIFSGLGTKKGIFRWNFMGKRVDCSARTVAGPGYELNFGEIMIPQGSAKKTLLVPVIVNKVNQIKVIERFRKGDYKFMQMSLVSEKGAFPIKEEHIRNYIPEIGDVMLRPLENGDRGLVGRQPSLHKFSIQGGHFRLNHWDTVKIHNLLNHGLNADFDGDEFTYHILQNVIAMAECEMIMNSKYMIMNDQSNRPMMAMTFHGLMGTYLMTKFWIINGKRTEVLIFSYRFDEALSLLNNSYRKSSLFERLERWNVTANSGRALFSVTLPTNFTYKGNGLEIIDGVLIRGVLKKANIGLKVNSLVQIIHKVYGPKEAARFLNDCQKIADWFCMWNGLSIGYKEFDNNSKEVRKMIKEDLNKMQVEYYNLGPKPSDAIELYFWMRSLHGIVDKTKINGKKIGEKFLRENNTLNILSEDRGAGVKGSLANTSQITGSLGEQFVGSNIPIPVLKNGTRCLIFYVSNDVALESMGYVAESYFGKGISPAGSYFHQMASRITLIDTARNVSEIGYTHRRVSKSVEQILINNLGMIVSTDGKMIQPLFGCGLNVGKTMPVKSSRSGEKIYFCDPKVEADVMNRIYEKRHNITHDNKRKHLSEYELFKKEHGRFPKLSELLD